MSSHPVYSLYTPTAIEEAYGVYIYDALFGNFPTDGELQLEKKHTLKILEKSNVDSIILKTAWTVVDPDGARCLTDMAQFHVLLRLIALAQDGVLEQEINRAFNQQRNQTTPVAVFKKTLWMSMDEDYPLPSFQGVPMPSQSLLDELSARLKGTHKSISPAPVPAPTPIPHAAPTPVPAPYPQHTKPTESPRERQSSPTPNATNKKQYSPDNSPGIDSAIQQIENLGMDSPNPDFEKMKQLDPENLELLQEQAALQRAIMESNAKQLPTKVSTPDKSPPQDAVLSEEEEALQRAIYESTYEASSPKPIKNAAVAAAPQQTEHKNWLRMSSLEDSLSDIGRDDDSDDEYKKKKKPPKGDAYAEYVASLDPTSTPPETKGKSCGRGSSGEDFDKKPAAKPPPTRTNKPEIQKISKLPPKVKDDRIDEYPQAVQELVMNGFELQKAIQGYKMLGDNFDDIVLFLTSNMTVKELVINGFNIHKVVQAYDLIGDNMDDLLAYLMTNAT